LHHKNFAFAHDIISEGFLYVSLGSAAIFKIETKSDADFCSLIPSYHLKTNRRFTKT